MLFLKVQKIRNSGKQKLHFLIHLANTNADEISVYNTFEYTLATLNPYFHEVAESVDTLGKTALFKPIYLKKP